MAENDELLRAYSRLRALRENAPEYPNEIHVNEFHSILDKLEQLGYNITDFRIPQGLVHSRRASSTQWRWGGTQTSGEAGYTPEPRLDRALFLAKLDGILTYFELILQKPEQRIGFKPPSRE